MYFAAGYRHQSEGERFSSLVSAFPQVKEVYFPWVREPSGRPILGYGEGDDTETIKTVLHDELVALKSLGMRLDLLLNANCYGELAMSRELDIPTVATNDCHYTYAKDAESHDVLLLEMVAELELDPNIFRLFL